MEEGLKTIPKRGTQSIVKQRKNTVQSKVSSLKVQSTKSKHRSKSIKRSTVKHKSKAQSRSWGGKQKKKRMSFSEFLLLSRNEQWTSSHSYYRVELTTYHPESNRYRIELTTDLLVHQEKSPPQRDGLDLWWILFINIVIYTKDYLSWLKKKTLSSYFTSLQLVDLSLPRYYLYLNMYISHNQ